MNIIVRLVENVLKPRIRIRLAVLNKKQSDIYRKLEVSPQQFSNWVNGDSAPRLDMAFRLAKELDCTVDDLWDYKEE